MKLPAIGFGNKLENTMYKLKQHNKKGYSTEWKRGALFITKAQPAMAF